MYTLLETFGREGVFARGVWSAVTDGSRAPVGNLATDTAGPDLQVRASGTISQARHAICDSFGLGRTASTGYVTLR
jgi:hypothetical protein